MRKRHIYIAVATLVLVSGSVLTVQAASGTLDPPNGPGNTYSYTLEDIYNRLNAGTAGTQSAFTEPADGPGMGTMHTLNDIMGKAPAEDNSSGAAPAEVLTGKTYWSLRTDGTWGPQAGTMPDNGAVVITPTMTNQTIVAGYHDGSGYVEGDADLVAGNIRSGVSIFGVTGELHGGCTCTGALNGTRWCDNGDGTVTDLTTCLVWLKDADWGGKRVWRHCDTYDDAHTRAGLLYAGATGANLTDGSVVGDWRLPTLTELLVLTHGTEAVRYDTPGPFTRVQSNVYWSSTTYADDTTRAFMVSLLDGRVEDWQKTVSTCVWPVRGGQ